MQIRPATPADVPLVLPMVEAISSLHERWDPDKYTKGGDIAAMYRGWLASRTKDGKSVFLVAEREPGALAGFLVATIEQEIPIYKVQEFGFIHDLWVDATYRNEGIARQLVMLAIERFTEMGVSQVRLETAASNEAARTLFAKCGFRVSTIDMLLQVGEKKPG